MKFGVSLLPLIIFFFHQAECAEADDVQDCGVVLSSAIDTLASAKSEHALSFISSIAEQTAYVGEVDPEMMDSMTFSRVDDVRDELTTVKAMRARSLALTERLQADDQQVTYMDLKLSASQRATQERMRLSDLRSLRANGPAILTACGAAFCLFREDLRPIGIVLGSILGIPLVGGLAYEFIRTPDPILLQSKELEAEIRNRARFMRKGERIYVGLSNKGLLMNSYLSSNLSDIIGGSDPEPERRELNLWYSRVANVRAQTRLVRLLLRDMLKPLSSEWAGEEALVTVDLMIEKLRFGKFRLKLLITQPSFGQSSGS